MANDLATKGATVQYEYQRQISSRVLIRYRAKQWSNEEQNSACIEDVILISTNGYRTFGCVLIRAIDFLCEVRSSFFGPARDHPLTVHNS